MINIRSDDVRSPSYNTAIEGYGQGASRRISAQSQHGCQACPRLRVVFRKVSQHLERCIVVEAFESGVIIVVNEAIEEGIAMSMVCDQTICDTALFFASGCR